MTQQQIKLPEKIQKFLEDITWKVNPDFQIRNKAHPTGLYALSRVFVKLFNKEIDTKYITITNGLCWFPESFFSPDGSEFIGEDRRTIEILAHETIHEFDRKRFGTVPFATMFLFPQILALLSFLSLLAFWNPWWLMSLLFLLLLAPIPAPGRAWIEVRGYKTNMSFGRINGWDPEVLATHFVKKNFMSADYYFMMPFFGWTSRRLTDFSHESEPIYADIIKWYKDNLS